MLLMYNESQSVEIIKIYSTKHINLTFNIPTLKTRIRAIYLVVLFIHILLTPYVPK